jgi:hypothetical protein
MFSYVFASVRFVQPCQIRAIICHYEGRARPPGASFCDSMAITSMSRSRSMNKIRKKNN